MSIFENGLEAITKVVNKDDIYIQSVQMFGDTLHATVVVNHYRKKFPKKRIVWGVGEKYASEYDTLHKMINNVVIVPLPHTIADDTGNQIRRNWIKQSGAHISKGPCVSVSGFASAGDIATNVFINGGISKLLVERKTVFPLDTKDVKFAKAFIEKNDLVNKKFVALEYNSVTFSGPPHFLTWNPEKYESVIKSAKYPVVYLGSKKDPKLSHGIDGSGLTMVAASKGTNTPIAEVNIGSMINMRGCGYDNKATAIMSCTPQVLIRYINRTV